MAVFSFMYTSSVIAASHQTIITSDDLIIDETAKRAVFTGNVIITQPDLKLWANKVIVHYGPDGPSDITDFEALGNVKIEQPEQTVIADRSIYDPKTKILKLYGNVRVTNDSGTITGSELIVDTKNGTTSFPLNEDGDRVTAIFTPE